jgi:flagellar hook assembly protein FlgD
VLRLYNSLGSEIRRLVNEEQSTGYHEVRWDGCDDLGASVASGVYFVRLEAGGTVQTRKVLLAR